MPKLVDHAERRALLTAAVLDVADREGIANVTLQRIAVAAGVSVGMVQHYFASKAELMIAAHRALTHDVEERVDHAVASAEKRMARVEDVLGEAIVQLLPFDVERRREAQLRVVFAGAALTDPQLRRPLDETDDHFVERLREVIDKGKDRGEVPQDTGSAAAALRIYSMITGLTRLALTGSVDQEDAVSAVRTELAQVFVGDGAREG